MTARCGDETCEVKRPHWSHMVCGTRHAKGPHDPHVWDSEFVIYGPYSCPGYPDDQPPGNAHSDATEPGSG